MQHLETDPLQQLTRAFVNLATQTAEAQGAVSLPQMRLLLTVANNPGVSSADIGHELAISPSAVSRMADRLVEHGLLARSSAPGNRRVVVLELTEQGHGCVQAVLRRRAQLFEQVLDRLGGDADAVLRSAEVLAPALTAVLAAESAR